MPVILRPTRSRRNFTIGLFLGVASMLAFQYWRQAQKNSTAGMPPDEAAFVTILTQSRAAWIGAPNDLARRGIRAARAAALCKADPTLSANNWLGRMVSVTPDSFPDYAGKATARIIIALTADATLSTPSAPLLNDPSTMAPASPSASLVTSSPVPTASRRTA
jgi:hypothetical protein